MRLAVARVRRHVVGAVAILRTFYSQGAAVAIDYAVRNPDRVSHLILWGGFARGRRQRGLAEDAAESEAFITLMRQGWGKERSPFRDMFASLYLPEANDDIDVSGLLAQVACPTLVIHSEREMVAPLSEARLMASRIPGARFVALDSANHLVLHQEPAWRRALDAVEEFLGHP
ncbi:MAG: alpha/beta hydrolase [Alphaproteobacteria bacterium]